MKPLSRRFYRQPAEQLARALLGKRIVCGQSTGRIVETEAYLDAEDRASHARFGPTARSAIMFGEAGYAYVYFIYGMYDMFNIVSDGAHRAGAVLVRAAQLQGQDSGMARGPGKLTRALGIRRANHNGWDLTRGFPLWLTTGRLRAGERIARGQRIGVDYAGKWAQAPLRFWIEGHPAVSKHR